MTFVNNVTETKFLNSKTEKKKKKKDNLNMFLSYWGIFLEQNRTEQKFIFDNLDNSPSVIFTRQTILIWPVKLLGGELSALTKLNEGNCPKMELSGYHRKDLAFYDGT